MEGNQVACQNALGDVVFVQLPELQAYDKGAEASTVESVKAASGVYMPLDGEVLEVNDKLDASPELVNEDPMGEGWFFRFNPADAGAVAKLLDQDAYDDIPMGCSDFATIEHLKKSLCGSKPCMARKKQGCSDIVPL